GLPVPPPAAAARRAPPFEVRVPHRPVGLNGRLHETQHLGVPAEPVGPAGVPNAIVEHGAPPPRQHRGRHEARGVRPVLEQEPAAVDEPVEPRAVVGAEAAPHRHVMGAGEDVDGVELEPAHVLDEAAEAPGGLLGMNLPEQDCPGRLAFATRRHDHTDGEVYWLSAYKTFASVEPHPAQGVSYSTRRHPIQGFTWSDFSAKPGYDYTYEIVGLRG